MFDTRTLPSAVQAPADLPTEDLGEAIEARAARANADMCVWLELIAEFDRRHAWAEWGCLTCAHWVAWRCSVSRRSAREHVRVARALRELPGIHAEFALGQLSYSKVRALTRVASAGNEADLLKLAHEATAAQLELLVRSYSRASAVAAGEAHRNRYVSWHWEDDGSLSISANLPAEDGATVIAAIEAGAERLRAQEAECDECDDEGGSAEPPGGSGAAITEVRGSAEPRRVSRAEALVSIAADSMGGSTIEAKPAERNMVMVHVDAETLAWDAEGRCHLSEGPGLPPETARRIACDASVVTLLERDGEPLSVGRRTRSIPPPMRRAVEARDHGCRFPSCHSKRFVDVHHIVHWAAGGETSAENLIMLCRRHHRLVHEGGFSIGHASPDGEIVFRRPDGSLLESAPLPRSAPAFIQSPHELAPGPLRVGSGEPMNLHYAVDAMFQICERRRGP